MSVRPLTLALWLALLAGCGSSGGGEQQPPITPSTPASDALDLSPVAVTAPESGLAEGWAEGGSLSRSMCAAIRIRMATALVISTA